MIHLMGMGANSDRDGGDLMFRAIVIGVTFLSLSSRACTTFFFASGSRGCVGKALDWHQAHGMVLVNKRHVFKTALSFEESPRPAQWISKYGSVTFNQYGREFPYGGMNEAGLIVEIMMLPQTHYPVPDHRPTINELQWIQYQLDQFETVHEVISGAAQLRVSPVYAKVHYMLCDRFKECA